MMEDSKFSLKNLATLLFGFYIFINFFPSLRLLLIGGETSRNVYEYAFTVLPDIFVLTIIVFSVVVYFKGYKYSLTKFDWLMIILIVFNVIYGVILSGDVFISAEGFRITYLPMCFYFIGRLFFTEPDLKTLKLLLLNIFKFYIVYAILSFVLHFGFVAFERHLNEINLHVQAEYFIPRMGGFVLMPVLFGTMMSFAGIYFFYRLVNKEGKWNYLFIAIAWMGMFLSVSRGPIIAFLLAFVLITIISRQWRIAAYLFSMITVISFLFSWILVGSLTPVGWLFSSTVDTLGMGANNTRAERWAYSIHDFISHPAGYGLGHSGATAFRFLKGVKIPAAIYTTDGWYLKLACESGIFGLLMYLFVSGFFFYKSVGYIRKNRSDFFLYVFAIFIMVNIQNVVENVLDFYPYITLFWIIIGATQQIIMPPALSNGTKGISTIKEA